MSAKGTLGFILGSIVGAVAGATAGLLLAPRTGAESRAMAADAMNDAWDSAVDAYERGSRVVSDKISNVRPSVDATTDELRAKVDLARERMDQLRSSLSDAVNTTSAQVQDAVNANDSLEGYLFPKTYNLDGTPDANSIIRAMLDQYQQEIEDVNFDAARINLKARDGLDFTDQQILTVASIIEKED